MSAATTRRAHLAFLWHMHQPLYVDPATGRAEMPWVRLHGARSYLDVARLLDEHGGVHLTINFVPSLVMQLEAVAAGARDRYQELAEQPGWSLADRAFLLRQFFSVHWGRHVETRPRYRELLEKRGRDLPPGETARRAASFSDAELRDLTVLFHLAWIGYAARMGDRDLAELERKGRGYDEADLRLVLERGRAACARVLPLYRKLAERGQVELVASPCYHPIVPLVCDTQVARRAQPQLPLPDRYSAPLDARAQIARGRAAHARTFGVPPRGMWPPEGSISPEAIATYREEGIDWLASDEGNLWRSLDGERPRGDLYRVWHHQGMDLVFRDRDLSDRISFSYAFGETRASVEDLLGRARYAAAIATPVDGPAAPPLVPVILDGENPWEAYPDQGEPFLRTLFAALGSSQDLRPVAIGEHLAAHPGRAQLARLHSGSWIDSDFHIWIGDPVKNRAWDLLGRARRRYARAVDQAGATQPAGSRPIPRMHAGEGPSRPGLPFARRDRAGDGPDLEAAFEHLLAAEGSDWFWWFGEPFHTSEKGLFDNLFRAHLAAAWRALGDTPPPELSEPVAAGEVTQRIRPPRGLVHPTVDGRRTGYYEWLDAGRLEVSRSASGAMAETPLATALHFGCDRETLYLRLDPVEGALPRLCAAEIELALRGRDHEAHLRGRVVPGGASSQLELEGAPAATAVRAIGAVACVDIVELAVPLAAIGFLPGQRIGVSLRLLDGPVLLARYPASGDLELKVPDREFAADHWSV